MLDPDQALAFIDRHGAVLVSARGPLPRLTEAIAGEPIRGSWWAHRAGKHIFAVLRALEDSPELLVCRLVADKLSMVHSRLWPALVRCTDRIGQDRLARIREQHTASGKHIAIATAFPEWVPRITLLAAKQLSETDAARELGTVLQAIEASRGSKSRKRT
ncbi:MAG: hypothetical protein E6K53_11420 [Gammaproteobacteria bacterium]|nr:MAG: hypothetical protein E6K53_11420 [Gammaproteobacteria bacterium]